MKMKQVNYWAAQEQRWHEKWLEAQEHIDELEGAIRKVEDIALQHITDKTARDRIAEIVNHVWRGAR
jgi:hypothetical protein